MRHRIVAAVLVVVVVAGFAWMMKAPARPDSWTADEISVRISEQKAAMKAEMAAEGRRYEPGNFPNDWASLQRAYPYNRINFEELREAKLEAVAMRLESRDRTSYGTWVERGPTNIGARVTDLEIHPTSTNIVFAAMASGGVFKSIDGGTTWDPIFDDQAVLTIGDIALDPDDPDIIYVGTGEANSSSFSMFGMGMFKSVDGGLTWSYIGLEETVYIGRVVVDPHDTDRLWVAAAGALYGTNPERGVYRSLNAGDTWEQVLALTDSTSCIDIAIDPTKPDTIFAAMWERVRGLNYRRSGGPSSGIYRSYDGGDSWTELTNGLPTGSDVGRIGVSVSASNPSTVYAFYVDHPGYFYNVYKSTNGGDTWSATNGSNLADLTSSFGWYFGQIRIDPSDETRVFVMGVPFFRTENGGFTWSQVGSSNHVDHHAMAFDPTTPSRIFEGNDGGIYLSNNSGDTWTKLYDQPTNQFYAIEIDYQNPNRLYGGTQDNGTLRTVTGDPDSWERIFGGDGFYVLVDPTDSNTIYCEYQWGNAYKSTNFGYDWSWALTGVDDNDRRNWSSPIVMDPNTPETLYFGTYRVWKTTNGGGSWGAISTDLTNGDNGGLGTVTTIAVSPADPDAVIAGTDDSNVWITQNGGGSWANVSSSLPNRWVTQVAFDQTDADIAYATFSGLRWNEQMGHVYRTDDAGANWTDISGNLPNAPVNALVVDPDLPSVLYVGTDFGVYYTKNLGQNWEVLGNNMPVVTIYDLKIHAPTRTLAAGTHGRSIYSIDLNETTGIADGGSEEVGVVSRLSNSPNPFRDATSVAFTLARRSEVEVAIFDIAGRRIRLLESGTRPAGTHEIRWDGRNESGRAVASGVYFLRVEAGGQIEASKMSLMR